MNVLEKIDKLRIEKGWSIYKLAEESMLTYSTLANMFMRKTMPSISTLTSLCKGFDISLSQFFAETESDISAEDERQLLQNYRNLSLHNKAAVKELVQNLANGKHTK